MIRMHIAWCMIVVHKTCETAFASLAECDRDAYFWSFHDKSVISYKISKKQGVLRY